MDQNPIKVLAPDLILVDWGPMTLTVSVWDQGQPRPVMAAKAARQALDSLIILSDFKNYLKKRLPDLPRGRPLPKVVSRAVTACGQISDDLTPMAAVAGAAADQVGDCAARMGADRIIVNNGGDIALRLGPGSSAVVGIKENDSDILRGKLRIEAASGVGGVATSGWSGRSFSPGVADLVSVWAKNAALADAAATYIAGRTDVSGRNVIKVPARELDPDSDLGSRLVTRKVGLLTPDQKQKALHQGLVEAKALLAAGLILGCFLVVQGDSVLMDPGGLMSLT